MREKKLVAPGRYFSKTLPMPGGAALLLAALCSDPWKELLEVEVGRPCCRAAPRLTRPRT